MGFGTVGDCVSFAAQDGRFATGIIIPAGHTATVVTTNLSTSNELHFGYQLN